MRNRITKCVSVLAILCVLVTALAAPALAASYSKVYGQTQAKIRVRESASSSADVIDNIIKGACVYVTSSKTSGSSTFIKVRYRNSDGEVSTGWLCQSDSDETFVKILSATKADEIFDVKDGDLPSKRVGTFTAAQREEGESSPGTGSATTVPEHNNKETIKSVQRMLAALGYYNGEITGNVGQKTETAIKSFQSKNGLDADGVIGPATLAKLESVYNKKGSSSSGSSSSSSSAGLKLGDSGAAVRNLQSDLEQLGYYWADITGNFGSKTEAAVKLFQSKNNLTADGVAGQKTLEAIAAAMNRKGTSTSTSTSGIIQEGSQGDAVSQLQRDLKQLGYYYADITGNVGSKTVAAIKDFQEKNGLTADGVAGTKTLEAIAAKVKAAGGSVSSSASSSSASGLKLGSTGSKVSALQNNLTTLGYYYGDITGHYGSLTQNAVKKFQKARGLTQDGVAGDKTIAAIESAVKSSGGAVADSSSSAGSALREGDSGAAVKDLQSMLNKLEYYYGEITGHFGSLTKKAVRAFQDDNGLTVDGVAGVNTINKLRSMTGSSGSSSGSSSSGTTVSTSNSYGRITKNNVYLRASYSTSSASKASLDQGTKCRITKVYTVGDYKWYYVTVTVGKYSYKGYIRSDMIETISESEYGSGASDGDDHDSETLGMIRVTADNVALRVGPGKSYDRAGEADTGDVFYYIDTEDGWFRTKSGYWISKDYAKVMSNDEVDDYVGGGSSGSSGSSGSANSSALKYGDTGSDVGYIQKALKKLGYYDGSITNHYGNLTKQAVMDFQGGHGLSRDGVCGTKTMAAIVAAYSTSSEGGSSGNTGVNLHNTVYDLHWYNYKAVYNAVGIIRGKTFTLTDLKTGKSFNVYVQSTGQHADVEPVTANDTAIMCSIYGVSKASDISYVRRAMIATVGNYQFACSMYGEPHGSEVIGSENNYDGQFCIHFRESKTSDTKLVREENQAPIDQAVTYVKSKGKSVSTHLAL
ncbi:MAG: peptidoglycan-binding protein [Clostridia bacterium]|nr:peptidoglycan-binding protein [Clostridia bacterium]